jgi:hypothetical protein
VRPGSGIRQIVGSAYTNSSIKYPFSEVRHRNKPVRLESIRGLGYNATMRIREYADAEWPPVWPIFGVGMPRLHGPFAFKPRRLLSV